MPSYLIKLHIFILIMFFTIGSKAFADDDIFFENLISNNVKQTQFSALIKTVSVEAVADIRSDSGFTGYITYKFIAEVESVFKGPLNNQIEYYVTYEAAIKPVVSLHSQIISLCLSSDNRLYIPDNGYRIDATEKLIKIAREAANKTTEHKNTCN